MATRLEPSVDQLVDATPATRDRVVDLLRAGSIVIVVLWHWVFSMTNWDEARRLTMPNPIGDVAFGWALTWVLQVMPLFFIVGGVANLAAWQAARRSGDATTAFLRRRLARLGRPVLALLGVWGAIEMMLALVAPSSRGVLHHLRVVFVPLWFLGVYAAVVVLVPLTARAHERAGRRTLFVLGAAIVAADVVRFALGIDAAGYVTTALLWVFAHQLGYSWRDGTLLAGGRRTALAVAACGLSALVVATTLGPYPRSMVATEGAEVSNMFPTTLAVAALAVLQLGLALLAHPLLARWAERRAVWKAVVGMNGVAMTVFCWHMTALVVILLAWDGLGGPLPDEPTGLWWALRPVWLVLPGLALVPLVMAFRRVERPTAH